MSEVLLIGIQSGSEFYGKCKYDPLAIDVREAMNFLNSKDNTKYDVFIKVNKDLEIGHINTLDKE